MRRAAKIDPNQPEIVDALRTVGCLVQSLAAVGSGVPDLLVWSPFAHRLLLLEVKDPKSSRGSTLTEHQERWHKHWGELAGDALVVVTDVRSALFAVGALDP